MFSVESVEEIRVKGLVREEYLSRGAAADRTGAPTQGFTDQTLCFCISYEKAPNAVKGMDESQLYSEEFNQNSFQSSIFLP